MSENHFSAHGSRHEQSVEGIHEKEHTHVPEEVRDPWQVNDEERQTAARLAEIRDGDRPKARRTVHHSWLVTKWRQVTGSPIFWIIALLAFIAPMVSVIRQYSRLTDELEASINEMSAVQNTYVLPHLRSWPWSGDPSFSALAGQSRTTLTAIVRADRAIAEFRAQRDGRARSSAFRTVVTAAIQVKAALMEYQSAYNAALDTGVLNPCGANEHVRGSFDIERLDAAIRSGEKAVLERDRQITAIVLSQIYAGEWTVVTGLTQCVDEQYGARP